MTSFLGTAIKIGTIHSPLARFQANSHFPRTRLLLTQIRCTSFGKRWTPKEDKILTDMRSIGKPWDEIHAQIPNRTRIAVMSRWNAITPRSKDGRLTKYWSRKSPRYTAEDDRKFEKLIDRDKWGSKYNAISARFPERSPTAVSEYYRRALHPKVRGWPKPRNQRKWTREEVSRLLSLRNGERLHYHIIAAKLGRSAEGVKVRYNKAMRGRTDIRPKTGRSFTPEDDARIVASRKEGRSGEEIARQFPKKTPRAVQLRIWLLRERIGARRWRTAEEVAELKERLLMLRSSGRSWEEIMGQFPDVPLKTLRTYLSKARTKQKALRASEDG